MKIICLLIGHSWGPWEYYRNFYREYPDANIRECKRCLKNELEPVDD